MATKKPAAAPADPVKKTKAVASEATPPKGKTKASPKLTTSEGGEGGTRGRQPNIAGSAKIKLLVKENPKRAAAAERFALYTNGMTVDEYIAAGGKRADVNWDVSQGFIEVK